MKIGAILAIIFIVIYGLFWLLSEFGFIKGREKSQIYIQPPPQPFQQQPPSQQQETKISSPQKTVETSPLPSKPKVEEPITTSTLVKAASTGDYSKVTDVAKKLLERNGGRTSSTIQITEQQRQQARDEIQARVAQNAQQNNQNVPIFSSASSPDLPPTLQRTPGRPSTGNIENVENVENIPPNSTQAVLSGAEGRMVAAPPSPKPLSRDLGNIDVSNVSDVSNDMASLLFRPKKNKTRKFI
jgi:hypothetical protein